MYFTRAHAVRVKGLGTRADTYAHARDSVYARAHGDSGVRLYNYTIAAWSAIPARLLALELPVVHGAVARFMVCAF